MQTRRNWMLMGAAWTAMRWPLRAQQRTVTLWNGRDFTGWQRAGRGVWTIENGALVGRFDHQSPGPGYLLTKTEYIDFRLRLEFWISSGGNSGVYIREPARKWGHQGDDRPAHGDTPGYEVQVDFNSSENPTGSLYNVQRPGKLAGGEERWNRMEIECRGPQIKIWIDGELVNEYTPSRTRKGVIGLQVHGGRPHTHVVKYRNIELTDLSER